MNAHLGLWAVLSLHDCGPSGELPALPSSDQKHLKGSLSDLITMPVWGFICYDTSFLMPLSLPCSLLASSLVFVELVYERATGKTRFETSVQTWARPPEINGTWAESQFPSFCPLPLSLNRVWQRQRWQESPYRTPLDCRYVITLLATS